MEGEHGQTGVDETPGAWQASTQIGLFKGGMIPRYRNTVSALPNRPDKAPGAPDSVRHLQKQSATLTTMARDTVNIINEFPLI